MDCRYISGVVFDENAEGIELHIENDGVAGIIRYKIYGHAKVTDGSEVCEL